MFYVPQWPRKLNAAELVREELGEIGLEVEIRELAEYATSSAYLGRLGNADEQWDMAFVVWSPDYVDPFAYLNRILDTQAAGGTGLARFAEAPYVGLMREAARRSGRARAQVYAALDLRLRRDAAPFAPMSTLREATLVSARSGCLLRRPSLVLTTVCLKR